MANHLPSARETVPTHFPDFQWHGFAVVFRRRLRSKRGINLGSEKSIWMIPNFVLPALESDDNRLRIQCLCTKEDIRLRLLVDVDYYLRISLCLWTKLFYSISLSSQKTFEKSTLNLP